MCARCSEYDEKISRYRRLAQQVMDDLFAKRVDAIIAELIAERRSLHKDESENRA